MFRNCSVFHDLSTNVDYSTILYKFASMGRGKKLNEVEKSKSWTKTATVISSKNIESNNKKS